MRKLVPGLFSIFFSVAGVNQPSFAVVNDNTFWVANSDEERLIRQATIRLVVITKDEVRPFCSGVAFGPGEALSSGHCFGKGGASQDELRKGQVFVETYDHEAPGILKRIQVASVDFQEDSHADLALIKLATDLPIRFSIPLAYSGCDEGTSMISAGFGRDEHNKYTSTVRTANYRELSMEERDELNKPIHLSTDNRSEEWIVLRAQTSRKACSGDSGGPIFCKSKGQLALAAINANLNGGRRTIAPGEYPWNQFCRIADILVGSRVSSSMNVIEKWRRGPQLSTGNVILDWISTIVPIR